MAEQRRKAEAAADLEGLRQRVAQDAGCAEFPALAEAERRAGRLAEALRIAEAGVSARPDRLAGRVALGLALLDQGDVPGAQRELAAVFEADEPLAQKPGLPVEERAETHEQRPKPGRGERRAAGAPAKASLPVGEGSAFRTRTMARLLERQGDRGRAEEILEGLEVPVQASGGRSEEDHLPAAAEAGDPVAERAGPPTASEQKATLERWLRNVQRGRA